MTISALTRLGLNILIISFIICSIESKIKNNMFDPKIFVNKQMPISRLQAAGHRFSIPSTDSNYQLVGEVYESQAISSQKQIYNISNYKKSQSCTYFKSILQMNSLQGENLNYIALQSLLSEDSNQLYIIGMTDQFEINEKFLKIYSYNDNNFKFESQISFKGANFSQSIDMQIYMTKIGNETIFSDGNYLYRLQNNLTSTTSATDYYWARIEGWNTGINTWKGQQFLGLKTVIFQQKQLLLFLYTEKVVLYQYNEGKNIVKMYMEIVNKNQDAFQDVQIGAQNNSRIFIVTGNKLFVYSSPDFNSPTIHLLAGQKCTRIYIYLSTVHIICEYQKRSFIGEYFYNNVLILNRFYNDIENYRLLSYINNYFLMIGENDIILTSNGVNRKVLLDMPKNAYSQKFVSFGIQNILLLEQSQNSDFSKTLFAIGQDFVVLFELKFVPAEVWCYIQRPPHDLQKNILIVRNTSNCEMNQKRQTLKSICINLKPVQIFFQHYEMESNVTSIFVVVVILLGFVLAFLCLGCVFRQNMNYNHLVIQIKKKIKKLNKSNNNELRQL